MKILLLRHGETDTNLRGLTHKRGAQEGLNKTGQEQARHLADVCKSHGVQALYSSPELRATETARIISKEIGLEPLILEDLAERHWGAWEGHPWSDIVARLRPMSIQERYTFVPPNGESWEQMERRLKKMIAIIQSKSTTAAVITHGGALRALMPALKGEPLDTSLQYDFRNASVTIFADKSGALSLALENDVTHLS